MPDRSNFVQQRRGTLVREVRGAFAICLGARGTVLPIRGRDLLARAAVMFRPV